MNNKFWMLLAAILSVAVLLMGWFLGVSPKFDEMNAANLQRTNVEAQNASFQKTIDELKKESEKIDDLRDQLGDLQIALPPGDELSTFLGQLHELEGISGVALTSFTASNGEPFAPAPNKSGTTVNPLVTPDNFIVITINLKVAGTRAQVLDFVDALQYGDRLFLVNSLTVQRGSDSEDSYTGTITGFVYVLVDPSAPPPTPTPVGSLDTRATPSPSPAP